MQLNKFKYFFLLLLFLFNFFHFHFIKYLIFISFFCKYFVVFTHYSNIKQNNLYISEMSRFISNKSLFNKFYSPNINLLNKTINISYLLLLFIISLHNPISIFNFFIIFIGSHIYS